MDTITLELIGYVLTADGSIPLYGEPSGDFQGYGNVYFHLGAEAERGFDIADEEGKDGYWVSIAGWDAGMPRTLYAMPSDHPSYDHRWTKTRRNARIFADKQAALRHIKDCYGHLGGLDYAQPVAII